LLVPIKLYPILATLFGTEVVYPNPNGARAVSTRTASSRLRAVSVMDNRSTASTENLEAYLLERLSVFVRLRILLVTQDVQY